MKSVSSVVKFVSLYKSDYDNGLLFTLAPSTVHGPLNFDYDNDHDHDHGGLFIFFPEH